MVSPFARNNAAAFPAAPGEVSINPTATDPLTGCWTRRMLMQSLDERLACAGNHEEADCLIVVDLDRFRTVNETAGHLIGDELLVRAAARIRETVGPAAPVARLNGDEFAVVVSRQDGGRALADELVELLGRPYAVHGKVVVLRASVGMAAAHRDGGDADALLRAASVALRRSKGPTGGRVTHFESSMMERSQLRQALDVDLRAALAGQQIELRRAMAPAEFELHYQPQVAVMDRSLVGFEALVRWRHPSRGLVAPNDFIPLAEEMGLIGLLGDWVMRDACRFAARWSVPVPVAVNVSALQLVDPDALLASIDGAIEGSGLSPDRLEVEITESALVENTTTALQGIRARGIKLAMDDFGTGYSSLSQLARLSFDRLKIDRSFVNALPSGTAIRDAGTEARADHATSMIQAITALARGLDLSVLAEGVETEEQFSQLKAAGVADIQGYLISRPVPERQVPALIAKLARTDSARLESST